MAINEKMRGLGAKSSVIRELFEYGKKRKAEIGEDKVFDYVFSTFPNPDKNVGEWIQIRTREGRPQEKVVALPVKDPYHIIRNVILIIELLEKRKKREE